MATTESQLLLTAEEYASHPDSGRPTELVRGKVIEVSPAGGQHGYVCHLIDRIVGTFVAEHGLGRMLPNDTGVATERNPDSVRGPDVAFFSFARLPRGPLPRGFIEVPPDVAFEVRSPTDRWSKLMAKVYEFLNAGVTVVCVFEPDSRQIRVERADGPPQILDPDDDLALPEIAESFGVAVRQFFE